MEGFIYSFAGYELDTVRLELRQAGEPVHIEPQVFDVLRHLIANRDRVISKMELFDQVWGGAFVGESTLTSRIKTARQLVGDSGRAQTVIRTLHRRGYQFVADVVEHTVDSSPAHSVPAESANSAPSGTVSFLFTDIEGSSRLWERHPTLMESVMVRHDEILHQAVADHDGLLFASAGDGVAAAFERATDAVAALRRIRAALDAEAWPQAIELRVRLGVHTGEAAERDGDYLGATVNRAARIMAAAHGGQSLISDVTAGLLDSSSGLTDLGVCQIDPSMPSTRLWQVDGPTFPPLAGSVAVALPQPRTELIGRDIDLEQIAEALAEHRLVSLVGPGGAGKTTLALAAANTVLVSYPAGVVFVELASANDGGDIFRAVVETAGIEGPAAADTGRLAAHLARRSMLIVLDNCEHLLDECADFLDALLDAGSEATVLVTSREPLGIDGEVVLPVGSLAAHAPELFCQRARAAGLDTDLADDDPRISLLCERLDGLPLAIELAASQLRFLTLDDLVERLAHSLEMHRGGRSRARDRHATLDRTIAWSYDLLDAEGQRLLRQFGIFPGSFDLAAAEAIGGPRTTALLPGLVAKSLVTHNAATGRYRLLETIRAFAEQRLTDAAEVEEAGERLRWFVVERARATSRLDRWFSGMNAATLRADIDNVRYAFDRSMWSGHARDALEIHISCAYLFRNTLNSGDGRRWAARLASTDEELNPRDQLWLTLLEADIAQGTADHQRGAAAASEALRLAADVDDAAAVVLARLAHALHYVVTEPEQAQARIAEAIVFAGRLDDPRPERLLRAFLAIAQLAGGDARGGTELAEHVALEVEGDGYDVFIANWAAWTAVLLSADAERLRYWRQRQRAFLTMVEIPEPWMFLWSTALGHALEGDDPDDGLRGARRRADSEGHDIAADVVLALALVEHVRGNAEPAAELLGVIRHRTLNNLSHYLMVGAIRSDLRRTLSRSELDECFARGNVQEPGDVLDRLGITL